MVCPYLDRRREGAEQTFAEARPYCAVVESFVQPMRADICAERYGLDPARHCEFYREREGIDAGPGSGGERGSDGAAVGDDAATGDLDADDATADDTEADP